ncbi:MAG TPA: hypothetical protein VID95_14415 [Candidatus Limnocylindrales bacterium]|jgi:hypothetical protein
MKWSAVAAAGSIGISLTGVVLIAVNGGSLFGDFNLDVFLVGTIYAAVGGFILLRVPRNWLGCLLLVAGWLRFDRARYDGQRTVDAFAGDLRLDLDLASLREMLTATAAQAVRPASATAWLSPRATR